MKKGQRAEKVGWCKTRENRRRERVEGRSGEDRVVEEKGGEGRGRETLLVNCGGYSRCMSEPLLPAFDTFSIILIGKIRFKIKMLF